MQDSSTKPRRLMGVFLPWLATDRLRRLRPSSRAPAAGAPPADAPLAVVETVANARRLAAVDPLAARAGLAPGLTLADARARVPHLWVAEADGSADRAVLRAVAGWCERWTPFVALQAPDGVVLDITGCAHLFGGEDALLAEVVRRLADGGLTAQAALAGTARAAAMLARFRPGCRVPPGGEAEAVRALPVAALGGPPETALGLVRLGLDTVGAVAARPRGPLAARFGMGFLDLLDEALGRADAPISPLRPVPVHIAEKRFAEPMGHMDTAQAVLGDLTREVCRLLERHDLGARRLEAAFFRSDGAVRRVEAATAAPLREPSRLLRLFRERLATLADPLDPGFGFDLIRLSVTAAEPFRTAQGRLDGADGAGDLSALVDVLSARLGARRVMRVMPADSHVPEAAAVAQPARMAGDAAPALPWPEPAPAGLPPVRPLTLFPRPEPVEALAQVPDGPPLRFRWRRVLHEVVAAEGPERIAGEWWQDGGQPHTRDYFRVEDALGHRFWLFREGLYGRETAAPRWFVHGLFA